jgi:hypothetical protein
MLHDSVPPSIYIKPHISQEVAKARDSVWNGQPHKNICIRLTRADETIVRVTVPGAWPYWHSYGDRAGETTVYPITRDNDGENPTGELGIQGPHNSLDCLGYATDTSR